MYEKSTIDRTAAAAAVVAAAIAASPIYSMAKKVRATGNVHNHATQGTSANKFRYACSNANEKWWEHKCAHFFALISLFCPLFFELGGGGCTVPLVPVSFSFWLRPVYIACVNANVSINFALFGGILMVTFSFDNRPHSKPAHPMSNYARTHTSHSVVCTTQNMHTSYLSCLQFFNENVKVSI